MNEAAAAEVLLLRAFETHGGVPWSDADADAVSRSARQAVGEAAPADVFVAARARAGLQRLAPQAARLARWLRPWGGAAALAAGVGGLVLGLAVDRIGGTQYINLLAPPVWALLAWNLAVYLALSAGALRAPAAPGALRRALLAAGQRWRGRARAGADGSRHGGPNGGRDGNPWRHFAVDWAALSLPLQSARLAAALHLGAAALALGLLAGMYLRGLVLDYRVGWQSTFLDAAAVRALLGALLAPASALSGIGLPDVAGMQALREPQAAAAQASAAPWIHLYALQLLLLVVLPRLALACWAGWRARRLQRQFPLPLNDAYFQRLLRRQPDAATTVRVWPHARSPDARALAALQRLVAGAFGAVATLRLAPTVAYGAEDDPAGAQAADGGADGAGGVNGASGVPGVPAVPSAGANGGVGTAALRLVLCDLGATPEPESQGRLLRALAPPGAARPWLLLDEAAFVRRFGASSPRVEERRRAWRALADADAGGIVFADLQADDLRAAADALREA